MLQNLQNALHNGEIVHAQFSNFSRKPDANPNFDRNPNLNLNNNPNPSQIAQCILQIVHNSYILDFSTDVTVG